MVEAIAQTPVVAPGKVGVGMAGLGRGRQQLLPPCGIRLPIELKFGFNRVQLAVDRRRRQEWMNEELRQSIEGRPQILLRNGQMVGGGLPLGPGIVGTAVLCHKGLVVVLGGVLGTAHEEQVLEKVGEAVNGFVEASGVDHDGGGSVSQSRVVVVV